MITPYGICADQNPPCNGSRAGKRIAKVGRDIEVVEPSNRAHVMKLQHGRCFRCGRPLATKDALFVQPVASQQPPPPGGNKTRMFPA